MLKIVLGFVSTLGIIFLVPVVVYGLLSAPLGMKTPEGASPAKFLLGVLITKIGTALLLTLLFHFATSVFYDRWWLFSLLFIVMFIFGEIGQTFGPNYSWKEAVSGIVSEVLYIPLSVIVLRLILR